MRKMRFYTLWMAFICVAMFIIQVSFSGFTEALLLNEQSFEQPWRFVTAIFLHGSATHLFYNLFALLLFGLVLEGIIKSKNFLIVFLSTGIFANLVSVNFYPSSLGASGAILGIIGTLTLLRPKMMVWAFGMPLPLFLAAFLWAMGDVVGLFIPSNIGNIAHLSGLGLGLVIGFFLRKNYKREKIRFQKKKIEIPEDYVVSWENKYMLRDW